MTPTSAPDDNDARSRTVAVLLAAGGGSRFTGSTHKLLATVQGRAVAQWSIEAVLGAGLDGVVIVTGSVTLPIEESSRDRVTIVHNSGWADGQATSVRTGVEAARALGATAVVVGLADQPFVTSDAWRAVAASTSPIAVATYGGVRGNPVRLAEPVWDLLPRKGDIGARSVMQLRPELVEEVPCQGSAADIDTLEDLERWT